MKGGEIDTVGHVVSMGLAQGLVGGTCNTDIQQGGHQPRYILRHGATDGYDQGMLFVAQRQMGHNLQIADGFSQPCLQIFGVHVGLGGENDEVGDGVAVTGEVDQHAAFVADLVVGQLLLREGRNQFGLVGRRMVGHV